MKGAVGAAALGLGLPHGLASAKVEMGAASGELTARLELLGYLAKEGLHALIDSFPNKNVTVKLNEVDHNTFQENITTYLQNPDDVIPWFAGLPDAVSSPPRICSAPSTTSGRRA